VPDRKNLFLEDAEREEREETEAKQIQKQQKQSEQAKRLGNIPFDIDAPNLDYDTNAKKVTAKGGIRVTYGGGVIEAEEGTFDLETKNAELQKNIFFSDVGAEISAEQAYLNLDTKAGELQQCDVLLEQGGYQLRAKQADKNRGQTYNLREAQLTTCDCPGEDPHDCSPWSMKAERAKITRNGWGQVWDATLRFSDVPVLYLPYFAFPAKTDRQTGFLPATIGGGGDDGFKLRLPFFWAISESTDATITPIIETESRYGSEVEFRKVFSQTASVEMGGLVVDESPRDGDLRGTDVSGLNDPTIDDTRTAGWADFSWNTRVGETPLQVIVDGNYVGDDLMLRELELDQIGDRSDRFVTSTAVARTEIASYSVDLSGEFNQALVEDDDFVLQRLPELDVRGTHRFRPFGRDQFGTRLIWSNQLSAVNFQRDERFDGWRFEAYEDVRLPFHFKNYFDAELGAGVRGTLYELDETVRNSEGDELDSSSDRVIPDFRVQIDTAVEKVFEAEQGGLLTELLELGQIGRKKKVTRYKHSVEPFTRYLYVPQVGQEENPQFDSNDRRVKKNVVTYGIIQRWFARFDQRDPNLYGIEETTPEEEDFESLRPGAVAEDMFDSGLQTTSAALSQAVNRPQVLEFASLELSQSVDMEEVREDDDPDASGFSDLLAELILTPNEYFRMRARADLDTDNPDFDRYSIEGYLRDKRGDELRSRLTFVTDRVRQLESSVQIKLIDWLKLGYYSRYDDLGSEFIENSAGLRWVSKCDCWWVDFTVSDKLNPEQTEVAVTLTLKGLGQFGNSIFSDRARETS